MHIIAAKAVAFAKHLKMNSYLCDAIAKKCKRYGRSFVKEDYIISGGTEYMSLLTKK